jgi:plastocyanin
VTIASRRRFVQTGGAFLVGLIEPLDLLAAQPVEIQMLGDAAGSNVWFDPIGLHVQPGQAIRWVNKDAGNSHTATAYHPSFGNHSLRIPRSAEPWNSEYLLPDETFEIALTIAGVYDYFCIPHEHAGMVGRIIVGHPALPADHIDAGDNEALKALPSVRKIIAVGRVQAR